MDPNPFRKEGQPARIDFELKPSLQVIPVRNPQRRNKESKISAAKKNPAKVPIRVRSLLT
jgi:hypothetical protein